MVSKTLRPFVSVIVLMCAIAALAACSSSDGNAPTPAPASTNANLSALALSGVTIDPAFGPNVLSYSADVGFATTATQVTPSAEDTGARITVNGASVASGTASAAEPLNVGANTITIVVTAENRTTTKTYTITIERQSPAQFAQEAYLKASNPDVADNFGSWVALSGDGSTLAVGARFEDSAATGANGDQSDNTATSSGAVYVFVRDNISNWVQQAYLKASNSEAFDTFNGEIDISDDGSFLAIGAPFEDSAATGVDGDQADNSVPDAGAVYLFARDGAGVWSQQAYIKASNTDADDRFGIEVDLSGDASTLAVGTIREDSTATGVNGNQADNSGIEVGAVYVFTRDAMNVWSQQAYIKASNANDGDLFADEVDLSGDGSTLVVSALAESSSATGINGDQADNGAPSSGAVYVFTRDSGGVWTQQAYIKASNAEASDFFGGGMALSNDGSTLTVSATGEDGAATGVNGDETSNSALSAGAVYVFQRNAGTWSQEAYIKASNTEASDFFGNEIDFSDDGNTLAVSATGEDSAAVGVNGDQSDNTVLGAGAVYVFTRDSSGTWTQQAYIKASNPNAGDGFGNEVDLSDDGTTLGVAALNEDSGSSGVNGDDADNSTTDAGAVYVFEL